MARRTPPEFQVGDRIAYAVAFIRSTGQQAGPAPFMRATVTEIGTPVSKSAGSHISFTTDGGQESGGLACNFTLVSRIAIDAALNP
ncbi:MAG: hypothetical protein M9924_22060 [Rhizobiaceae bacterium]|nr:hypothetical protein [Rhizobiaceae bacterium]